MVELWLYNTKNLCVNKDKPTILLDDCIFCQVDFARQRGHFKLGGEDGCFNPHLEFEQFQNENVIST